MRIVDKLRAMQVKRYPISHVNRDQSMAEHSYCVMLIALELISDMQDEGMYIEVMAYSLLHDMDEVETGDIPSPFKRKLRRECPAVIPVLDGQPKASDEARLIVKVADMLEALYYIDEFGGSRTTEEEVRDDIQQNLTSTLANPKLPQSVVKKAMWLQQVL